MALTLVRILVAAGLSCLAAGFVFELVEANEFDEPLSLARIVGHAVSNAPWTLPLGAAFVALSEWLKLRHWLAFLLGGAVIAFLAGLLKSDFVAASLTSLAASPGTLALAVMGGVGGLVYWLAHGRWAGWAGDDTETAAAGTRAALLKSMQADTPPRCWPCLLGGLALAALPLLAFGAIKITDPGLAGSITGQTEAEAGKSLAEAGHPWASLKVEDDVGRIVGTAPSAAAGVAAFAAAQKLLAPAIGIPGVMASLENRTTVVGPAIVASPAAVEAARQAAEDRDRLAAAAAEARAAADARAKAFADAKAKIEADKNDADRLAKAEADGKVAAEAKAKAAKETADGEVTAKAKADAERLAKIEATKIEADAKAAKALADAEVAKVAAMAKAKAEAEQARIAKIEAAKAEAERVRLAADAEAKRKADAEKQTTIIFKTPQAAPVPPVPDVMSPAGKERVASCQADLAKLLANEAIRFEPSSAVITAASSPRLDAIAAAAKTCAAFGLLVEGHADKTGNPDWNIELSQMRAEAVRKALIGRGVAAMRLRAQGFGSSRLIDPADNAEAHARNRRIEISVGTAN
jgi:outer membrane protein OmpA-like peptidoglycan-associated protein